MVKCQTSNFAAYWVKCTNQDGLRSVVNNDFYTSCCFKCANVTTFTSDDATFHFIVIDVENGNTIFNGCFCGNTLDSLNDNAFGLFVCIDFSFIHNLIDVALSVAVCLCFQTLNELIFSVLCRYAREFLELFNFALVHFAKLFFFTLQQRLLILDTILVCVQFLLRAIDFFLALVETHFALFQLILRLEYMLIALLNLFFKFCLFVQELLLDF